MFRSLCHLTLGSRALAEDLLMDTFRQLRDGPTVAATAARARLIGIAHQRYLEAAGTTTTASKGAASKGDDVRNLTPLERTALHLREVEGFSFAEVGRCIGCEERAAWSLVERVGATLAGSQISNDLRSSEIWLGDEARERVQKMLVLPPEEKSEPRPRAAHRKRLAALGVVVIAIAGATWTVTHTDNDTVPLAASTTTTEVVAAPVSGLAQVLASVSDHGEGDINMLTRAPLDDYQEVVPDGVVFFPNGTIGLLWAGPCNRPAAVAVVNDAAAEPSVRLFTGSFPVESCLGMPDRWSLVFRPVSTARGPDETDTQFYSALIDDDEHPWLFGVGCVGPTITRLERWIEHVPGAQAQSKFGTIFKIESKPAASSGSTSDDAVCVSLAQQPVLRTEDGLVFPRINGEANDRVDCRGPEGSLTRPVQRRR